MSVHLAAPSRFGKVASCRLKSRQPNFYALYFRKDLGHHGAGDASMPKSAQPTMQVEQRGYEEKGSQAGLPPTDIRKPDYFHKVVDCQWACPAHTPVPEYIRLIAAGRYSDAYMINWKSNVFPGILGRTCDRPCEPACRRGRGPPSPSTSPSPTRPPARPG